MLTLYPNDLPRVTAADFFEESSNNCFPRGSSSQIQRGVIAIDVAVSPLIEFGVRPESCRLNLGSDPEFDVAFDLGSDVK